MVYTIRCMETLETHPYTLAMDRTQLLSRNTPNYAAVIAKQGAEFRGVQFGPRGTLILFADPRSRSTLAVAESEFSPEAVSQRLQESRRAFDLERGIQKSLC
jgi:hypothetical protein